MSHPNPISKSRSSRKSRPGIASLEFAMYLPFFVGFMCLIFWVARVQHAAIQSHLNAEMSTRTSAIRLDSIDLLSGSQTLPSPNSEALLQLIHGFDPRGQLFDGLVIEKGRHDSGEGVGDSIDSVGEVEGAQLEMSHAWESERFPFPQDAGEQKPLTLPESARSLDPRFTEFDEFRKLLDFSIMGGVAQLDVVGPFFDELNQSIRTMEQAITQLNREIDDLEERITALGNLENPDQALMDELRKELDQKRGDHGELEKAIELAKKAKQFAS